MLGSFMDDIGITVEQFEEACQLSQRDLEGLPLQFHRRLFQQIWAANDYTIFVKMMTHKNVELQLQALELIERRFGVLPNIFQSDSEGQSFPDTPRSDESTDFSDTDDVMSEIKKLQLKDFRDNDEVVSVPEPREMDVVAEKKTLINKLQSFDKQESLEHKLRLDPVHENSAGNSKTIVVPIKKTEVSEEEVQQRQVYLKQQRDKLLALKKQVRERQLGGGTGEGEGPVTSRPVSARAAQAVLAGRAPAPPTPDAMQLRRALVDRLKAEVVDIKQ